MLVTMTSNSDPGCIDLSATAASKVGQNADHPTDLHVANTDINCETRQSDNEHFDGAPPVSAESFSAHERDDSAGINPPASTEHGADKEHIDHQPEAIAGLANKKCEGMSDEDPVKDNIMIEDIISSDEKESDIFEDAQENVLDIEDEPFNEVYDAQVEGNVAPILVDKAVEDAKSNEKTCSEDDTTERFEGESPSDEAACDFDRLSAAGDTSSSWENEGGKDKESSSESENAEPKECEMFPSESNAPLEKLLSAVEVSDACPPVDEMKNEGNNIAVDQRPSSSSISSLDVIYDPAPRPQAILTVNRMHTAPTEISSVKSPKDSTSSTSTEMDQMSVATKYFNKLAEVEKARKAAEYGKVRSHYFTT